MIDCTGTKFELVDQGNGLWTFEDWQNFLKEAGLLKFEDFCNLKGKVVDKNRRSLVYRLELGPLREIFYLKIHTNYYKQGLKTLLAKIPYTQIELNNMMRYARVGLSALEPVAWGWRPETQEGAVSFLLIKELTGYKSLQEWYKDPACSTPSQRRPLAQAVAKMVATMHGHGLAHIDLFSWHIFVKKDGDQWFAQAIDLERTRHQGCWPWSRLACRFDQAHDLAALHLTTPWPQISFGERMHFFKDYCSSLGIPPKRAFLRVILLIARHLCRKKRFRPYGLVNKFLKK